MDKGQKVIISLFVFFWVLFFSANWIKGLFFPAPKILAILIYVIQFDLLLVGAWLSFKSIREGKKGFGMVFLALCLLSLVLLAGSIMVYDFLGSQLHLTCPDGTVMDTFSIW